MANPVGESSGEVLRVNFDRRLMLQFRVSWSLRIGIARLSRTRRRARLSVMAGETLADARTGMNRTTCRLSGCAAVVFGRLAGYEDVNDAERLRHDPAMRWVVGGRAAQGCAASASQMGRFETRWLTADENLLALADLSVNGSTAWHARRPPRASSSTWIPASVQPMANRRTASGTAITNAPLSSAVRVQPVWRPGALRPSPRQRP